MKSMQIRRKKESGQSLVEYGLILGLIVVVVIVIMGTMGGKIKDIFSDVYTVGQGRRTYCSCSRKLIRSFWSGLTPSQSAPVFSFIPFAQPSRPGCQ